MTSIERLAELTRRDRFYNIECGLKVAQEYESGFDEGQWRGNVRHVRSWRTQWT